RRKGNCGGTPQPRARQQPQRGRNRGRQKRVRDFLHAGVPLAVEQREREVLQFRDDDAMLVMRLKKLREKMILLEPWDEEVARHLLVPWLQQDHFFAEL